MSIATHPHVTADSSFHIFTTFRLDSTLSEDAAHTQACDGRNSDIYLLPYHFRRLLNAAAAMNGFNIPGDLSSLDSFETSIHSTFKKSIQPELLTPGDVRRGKVSLWPSGHLEVTLTPVPQTFPILLPKSFDDYKNPTWTVILDEQATKTDLYTEIKTSYRKPYDRARQIAGLGPSSTTEVLLYNERNEVMDGSITNVYFYRDNKWVTPDSGGLKGAARQFALDCGLCSTASSEIGIESLRSGEIVWLSNAFRGFFAATFALRGSSDDMK